MGNTQNKEKIDTEMDEEEEEEEMDVSPPSELELRARQIDPAEQDYPFENIVLEGGGSKGCAYCGVIRVLEEIGLYPQIKRFSGTSAGAITAALLAAGYNSYEIETFMKKDISKDLMLDGSFAWRMAAYIPRLISGYGLSGASQFNQWLGEKLKEKAGSADVTFDQLYKISGKELCIVVTNVNNMVEEYCHPKTTPDMPVRLAVRMSMSIPGLFQMVTHRSAFHLSSDVYVDGGILCNYPIHCFDGWWLSMEPKDAFIQRMKELEQLPLTLSNEKRFRERSDKTLGIQVYSETEIDTCRFYIEKREPLHVKPDSALSRIRKAEKLAKTRERKRIADAVKRFFLILEKFDENKDGKISKPEFEKIYDQLSDEDKQILFREQSTSKVFKSLDENSDGQVTFADIVRYIEQKGLSANQVFLGHRRQDVNGFVSYISSIFNAMLLNMKQLYIQPADFGRTVGINTGHVETTDFDLSEEDVNFLVEQGRRCAVDFLKMYAAERKEK